MAQQTAVEWLYNKLSTCTYDYRLYINYWFEQAKQMEKEQKIGLLKWMNEVSEVDPMRLETDHDDIVEQYYNEIYGNNQNK